METISFVFEFFLDYIVRRVMAILSSVNELMRDNCGIYQTSHETCVFLIPAESIHCDMVSLDEEAWHFIILFPSYPSSSSPAAAVTKQI